MEVITSKFDSSNAMAIIESTVKCHRDLCTQLNIFEKYAETVDAPGIVGGNDANQSEAHLLGRFINSASRTQLTICRIDPDLEEISLEVMSLLIEGEIYLIDIAAGHGAGTLSIINSICHLRHEKQLGTELLTINIHAIDSSQKSLQYFGQLIEILKPIHEAVGIKVRLTTHTINLTDEAIALPAAIGEIKKTIGNNPRYLLVCSAISGVSEEKFKSEFVNSFKLITKEFQQNNSAFFWIEPQTRKEWMPKIQEEILSNSKSKTIRYHWHDPYLDSRTIESGACIFLMELAK